MDEVYAAERALLGGLVLEPARLGEVAGWLLPEDFALPECALVYQRLLGLREGGSPAGPAALVAVLRERGELRRDGYPVTEVARMFDAVPVPARLPLYGRLVVEGAAARQVTAAGRRLEQACAQSRDPGRLLAAAGAQRAALAGVRRRLHRLPGVGPGPGEAPVSLRATGAGVEPDRATVRVELAPVQVELATIGSLLLAPQLAEGVRRWLRPADFADPGCRRVFDRIGQLGALGAPIDRVTLVADVGWRGRPGSAGQLIAVLDRAEASVITARSAGFFARRVLAASVARQTAAAAGQLITAGQGRRGGADRVLEVGLAALDSLDEVRRRTRTASVQPRFRAPEPGASREWARSRRVPGRSREVG